MPKIASERVFGATVALGCFGRYRLPSLLRPECLLVCLTELPEQPLGESEGMLQIVQIAFLGMLRGDIPQGIEDTTTGMRAGKAFSADDQGVDLGEEGLFCCCCWCCCRHRVSTRLMAILQPSSVGTKRAMGDFSCWSVKKCGSMNR